MLHRHTDALTLYATNHGCADHSRDYGVLAVVFEVAATERIAVEVHTRAEDDVAAILQGLVALTTPHLLHEVGIPRAGQTGAHGKTGGKESLTGSLAVGVDVHTGRTVADYRGGNAQPRDGHGDTGCSSY